MKGTVYGRRTKSTVRYFLTWSLRRWLLGCFWIRDELTVCLGPFCLVLERVR